MHNGRSVTSKQLHFKNLQVLKDLVSIYIIKTIVNRASSQHFPTNRRIYMITTPNTLRISIVQPTERAFYSLDSHHTLQQSYLTRCLNTSRAEPNILIWKLKFGHQISQSIHQKNSYKTFCQTDKLSLSLLVLFQFSCCHFYCS